MKDYILGLDRPRTLRFGFRSTRAIREKFGDRSFTELMNMKLDEIPMLAWAGLMWEDKNLTVEQTEDLLDAAIPKSYTLLKIAEIVLNALADQMGMKPKKAKAGGPGKKKLPTKKTPSTKARKK